jgi:hypothetical protein
MEVKNKNQEKKQFYLSRMILTKLLGLQIE